MSILNKIRTISRSKGAWLKGAKGAWSKAMLALIAALLLAALWQFTPLQHYTDLEVLRQIFSQLQDQWWIPLAIPFVYMLAHALMFPNMVLDAVTILTFKGLEGWSYAMLGSLSSASFYFMLGRYLGLANVLPLSRERLAKLISILRKGGLGTVLLVRLVPLAPFTVVNLAAGSLYIRYRDFLLGTFIALLPGTLTVAFFGQQLKYVLQRPNFKNMVLVILILIVGGLCSWLLKNYIRRRYPGAGDKH